LLFAYSLKLLHQLPLLRCAITPPHLSHVNWFWYFFLRWNASACIATGLLFEVIFLSTLCLSGAQCAGMGRIPVRCEPTRTFALAAPGFKILLNSLLIHCRLLSVHQMYGRGFSTNKKSNGRGLRPPFAVQVASSDQFCLKR